MWDLRSRKVQIVLIVLVVFGVLLVRHHNRVPKRNYSDFRVYYAAAERVIHRESLYIAANEQMPEYKYSPVVAFLFVPLAMLPIHGASLVFFVLNFVALVASLYLSEKIIDENVTLSYWQRVTVYVLPIVLCARYILKVFDSGQVGICIYFLIVIGLYWLRQSRVFLAAFSLGLSVMFKVVPLLYFGYFVVRRYLRMVIGMGLALVFYSLLPGMYVGFRKAIGDVLQWIPHLRQTTLDQGSMVDYQNQSIYSLILRYFKSDSIYAHVMSVRWPLLSYEQCILGGYALGFVLYVLILLRSRNNPLADACDYGLLFICIVLFNANAWTHNFVALLFGYMVLVSYLIRNQWRDRACMVGLLGVGVFLMGSGEFIIGDALQYTFEVMAFTTLGTLGLFLLLLKVKFFPIK